MITNGGNGVSAGQPIPGVGLNVRAANTDPSKGPTAACEGGTVITNGEGVSLLQPDRTGVARNH